MSPGFVDPARATQRLKATRRDASGLLLSVTRTMKSVQEKASLTRMPKRLIASKAAGKKDPAASRREPWKAFQARQRSMVVKRDAVLRTAAHLFLEHGYQKSSMSLLANQLKITKPALYYYFRNKEEILVECYRNGIAYIENLLKQTNANEGTGLRKLFMYVET